MQTVEKLTYESDKNHTITIRTTVGELNVNAPNGTVRHYGYAESAFINAVADASYHEFGKTGYTEFARGHFIAEIGAEVNTLLITGAKDDVTIDSEGGKIKKAYASNEDAKELNHGGNVSLEYFANAEDNKQSLIISATKFAGGLGTEENPYLIEDVTQLENVAYSWDEDLQIYFKIKDGVKEIDCTNYYGENKLNGSFDGNGVRFTNLKTWLFDYADGKISNLDANMNMVHDSAGLVRRMYQSITFEDVKVHGYLQGVTWASPFGCWGWDGKQVATYKFINCESDATVVATSGQVSGFINHPYCKYAESTFGIIDSRFVGNLVATNKGNCNYFLTNYNSVDVNVKYSEGFDVSGLYKGAPENGAAFEGAVDMGMNLDYNAEKSSVLNMVTGELPAKGEAFSIIKQSNTVSADVYLIISPNGPNETGSYTGMYMQEKAIVIENSVRTTYVKYFDIAINGTMTTNTGLSGNTFNVVAAGYGKTHNGASVQIIEKDILGNVVCVTTFKIADATTPTK